MSSAKRLISGSLASWARMFVTMFTQIALVPIYLKKWPVETYGIWLGIQSLINSIVTLDTGHQNYMFYEFLKIGDKNELKLRTYLWSSLFFGVMVSIIQILIVVGLVLTHSLGGMLGMDKIQSGDLYSVACILSLLMIVNWLISSSIPGMMLKSLAPYGYFSKFSWFGVYFAALQSIAPAITVYFGMGLLVTGIVYVGVSVLFNLYLYYVFFKLLNKHGIYYLKPDLKVGFTNFVSSLFITLKVFLETFRQQSFRVLVSQLCGAANLVAFSTMRTGANFALQGINTIINPLEPELMRFIHNKDQKRMESAFATVWMVVIVIFAPCVVTLQVFMEPLFNAWTRGHVKYDAPLFASMSLSVLVYAVSQPAIAVIVGNNVIKPQIILSAIGAGVVCGLLYLFVYLFGLRGTGYALLCAEIVVTTGYRFITKNWLVNNGLYWPSASSAQAIYSVVISAAAMALMILFPALKFAFLLASYALLYINFKLYWNLIPVEGKESFYRIIKYKPKKPLA